MKQKAVTCPIIPILV